jgi:hypothetical protein
MVVELLYWEVSREEERERSEPGREERKRGRRGV